MTIEGVLEYEAVRDVLYSRMRGAREHPDDAISGADSGLTLSATLQSIAVELRGIRPLLRKGAVYDAVRGTLLRFLRVPAAPSPPLGSPESIRVFRAGPNSTKWPVIKWALKQTAVAVVAAFTLFGPF